MSDEAIIMWDEAIIAQLRIRVNPTNGIWPAADRVIDRVIDR